MRTPGRSELDRSNRIGARAAACAVVLAAPFAAAGDPSAPGEVNWAAGRPATQSSTRYSAGADRAVDGDRAGDWRSRSVARTDRGVAPYWEVDLGEVVPIREIRLYLRTVPGAERLRDVHVFVAREPFQYQDPRYTFMQLGVTFATIWGPLGDSLPDGHRGDRQTVALRTEGRYVRVQLAGEGELTLAEVEVVGDRPPAEPAAEAIDRR